MASARGLCSRWVSVCDRARPATGSLAAQHCCWVRSGRWPLLEYLQSSDRTLMFECFIVQMESVNWVLFILCLNSVQEINKSKPQSTEASLIGIQFTSNKAVALSCSSKNLNLDMDMNMNMNMRTHINIYLNINLKVQMRM